MTALGRLAAAAVAVSVAACSTVGAGPGAIPGGREAESSVAQGLSAADARAVSSSIVDFVSLRVAASAGPVRLVPPRGDGLLTPLLEEDLRSGGYQLSADRGAAKHSLAYQVSQMDGGVLVRLNLDRRLTAARYLARDAKMGGGLRPAGPYTVMEARR